ncbi:hypothetical protein FEF65_11420 [Mariprofundus erugo]|uniref:Uncharacterized protein n=1 Tax=Mariprofundus erugo TaxID=2528639 RepID=A0A5R9GQE6_9PROT|nr:hypothetical protein FEF65_11420 [Mariprofundus erugo]
MTQDELAKLACVSVSSIKALEPGNAKLSTMMAVLREPGALDALDAFIPEITISPLDTARRNAKKRERATRSLDTAKREDESEW